MYFMTHYLRKSILAALVLSCNLTIMPSMVMAVEASRTTPDEWDTIMVPGDRPDPPDLPYEDPYDRYGLGGDEPHDDGDNAPGGGVDIPGLGPDDEPLECEIFRQAAPAGCDLSNPPSETTNGCGSEGRGDAPDSWGYGTVSFTRSCNRHDECYGTLDSGKAQCDARLETDMEKDCENKYPPDNVLTRPQLYSCYTQANTYAAFLSSGVGSDGAYADAQSGAKCRVAARSYALAGCKD
jgi:hypothetical protein